MAFFILVKKNPLIVALSSFYSSFVNELGEERHEPAPVPAVLASNRGMRCEGNSDGVVGSGGEQAYPNRPDHLSGQIWFGLDHFGFQVKKC